MKKCWGSILFFLFVFFYSASSFAQSGSVYITSKPGGANISLDNNPIQKKSDTIIDNIPTGIHKIAVEHREYGKFEKDVEIREDLTATAHFSLLPKGEKKEPSAETKDAESYHSRGFTHFSQSQYDLALADFNKAIELDPASLVAYHNRGVVYFDLGQFPLAIADFTKAIDLGLGGKGSLHLRGVAYGKEERYDLAIDDLNRALEIDPHDASIYTNRGIFYLLKGQYKQTISDLSKAIELGSKNPAFYYFHLGFVLHKTGDKEAARENFTKARQVETDIVKKGADFLEKGTPETKRFYAEELLAASEYLEVQPQILKRAKELAEQQILQPGSTSPSSPPSPAPFKEFSSFHWILILFSALIAVSFLLWIVVRFGARKSQKGG